MSQLAPPGYDAGGGQHGGYDAQGHGGAVGGKPGNYVPAEPAPYTGFKHELPADNSGDGRQFSSELDGTSHVSPNLSTVSPHRDTGGGSDYLSASNVSTMGPGDHGSVGYVSPQSTGNGGYQPVNQGPASELQG